MYIGVGVHTCVQVQHRHIYIHILTSLLPHLFGGILDSYYHLPNFTNVLNETAPASLSENSERSGLFLHVLSSSTSVAKVGSDSFLGLRHYMVWILRGKC